MAAHNSSNPSTPVKGMGVLSSDVSVVGDMAEMAIDTLQICESFCNYYIRPCKSSNVLL